jgi:peptidoglycan/LPS O-acetylase OafA/YrhL
MPESRITALDGVRGAALLLMLGDHLRVNPNATDTWANAWISVDMFFVLSGFLITGILLDAKGQAGYYRRFYARRVLRIFPVYYATVLFLVLVDVNVANGQGWYWTHTFNWRLAWLGDEMATPRTVHFWSLGVEEQFYLVWPFVIAACPQKHLLRMMLGVALGSFALRLGMAWSGVGSLPLYVMTPTRLDGVALGAAVAVQARTTGGLAGLARITRPVALLLGIGWIAWILTVTGDYWWYHNAWYAVQLGVVDLMLAAVLVCVLAGGRLTRIFDNRTLRWFGTYSYGIYVIHMTVQHWARYSKLAELPQVEYFIAVLSLTLFVAVPVYHLWERPFLSLKRFVPMPRGPRPRHAPAFGAPTGRGTDMSEPMVTVRQV